MNLSAVLQTDLVFEVMRQISLDDGQQKPNAMYRKFVTSEEFIAAHGEEAALVRGGLEGELAKVLEEGKTIIIEGAHLDPSHFDNLAEEAARRRTVSGPLLTAREPYNFLTPAPDAATSSD